MFKRLWGGGKDAAARALYEGVVNRARWPDFFAGLGVADTLDGRFDLVALHAFLVMEALERAGGQGRALGTDLATLIFAGFEEALREMGVEDFGLSKRMKAMADAFYGRLDAYRKAVPCERVLAATLARNLCRGEADREAQALAMARYMASARAVLSAPAAKAELLSGAADFGPAPEA